MSLEHRTFTAPSAQRADNSDLVAWLRAVRQGFVGGEPTDAYVDAFVDDAYADGFRMRGVRDTQASAYALDQPVATFLTYDKTLNVGGAEPLPVRCITDVTVRATHRRRGLLRAMMTDELGAAAKAGLPLTALTVTEATIYGRFGFGPTSHAQRIEVDTAHGFALRGDHAAGVESVDRDTARRLGDELFARFHQESYGSIGRISGYHRFAVGEISPQTGEADPKVRNAIHTDADGQVDGWVAYAPVGEKRGTLEVRDLLALTPEAYLALWAFLGAIDLIDKVTWADAPLDDMLPWALVDPRRYRVVGHADTLWTRVLDPVAVLTARGYGDTRGRLVLRVNDPLGHADGTFAVDVVDGRGRASRSEGEADLTCGVEELGPLVLGGVEPRVLAATGRLAGSDEALQRAHTLFGALGRPWTSTHF